MIQHVKTAVGSYDIHIQRGALAKAGSLFDLDRRVLVLTDDGVPTTYAAAVCACCRQATLMTVPMGEGSKSIDCFSRVLSRMLQEGFTRTDAVVLPTGSVLLRTVWSLA